MSVWGEIKHAINSTLGTNDFKPLDKMIEGQNRMIVSEDVYATLQGTTLSAVVGETKEFELPKMKMIRYGTATLGGNFYRTPLSDVRGEVTFYKNGVQAYRWYRNYSEGTSTEAFNTTINFAPNDIISIKMKITAFDKNGTLQLKDFVMKGKVVPNVFEEI